MTPQGVVESRRPNAIALPPALGLDVIRLTWDGGSAAAFGYYSWPRWRRAGGSSQVKRDQRRSVFQRGSFSRRRCVDNHEAGSARRPVPKEVMMRFYNQQHRYYCGIDLHARSMFIHILDAQGQTR